MNKKRNFAKMALLGVLLCGLASPTFIGCKDYDDDIDNIISETYYDFKNVGDFQIDTEICGRNDEGDF